MAIVCRFLALYLLLMAAAVAVHYIITPLYHDGVSGFPAWRALNWPMGAAVVIALAASAWPWLRGRRRESVGWSAWLSVNLRFYGSLALAMAYLNNWFVSLRGNAPPSLDWGLWTFCSWPSPCRRGCGCGTNRGGGRPGFAPWLRSLQDDRILERIQARARRDCRCGGIRAMTTAATPKVHPFNAVNRGVYLADNLAFLCAINDACVDLVTIDPPFAKNETFAADKLKPAFFPPSTR